MSSTITGRKSTAATSSAAAPAQPRAIPRARAGFAERFGAAMHGKAGVHGMLLPPALPGAAPHGAHAVGAHAGPPALAGKRQTDGSAEESLEVDARRKSDSAAASAEEGAAHQHAAVEDRHDDVRLDALSRHLEAQMPTAMAGRAAIAEAPAAAGGREHVEQLASKLLEMFAVGTHQGRPMARMVVATGKLAGAELTLTQDGKRVALQIEGVDAAAEADLRERVGRSLAAKGIGLD